MSLTYLLEPPLKRILDSWMSERDSPGGVEPILRLARSSLLSPGKSSELSVAGNSRPDFFFLMPYPAGTATRSRVPFFSRLVLAPPPAWLGERCNGLAAGGGARSQRPWRPLCVSQELFFVR